MRSRFIERDSTTQPRRFAALFDWLLAASLALTVLVFTAGIDFRMAGVTVRSHSAVRVFAGAIALFLVRRQFGIAAYAPWLTRIALLMAICGSVATWFRFLLATIGGADSYGYVSASHLIASGRLIDVAPIAEWLTAPNRLAIASPLGWTPAPDGSGIAPAFPIGASSLMALFTLVGGQPAVFLVAPIMALLTLALVYRLGRDWFDRDIGLLAVALLAWNPVFLTYAKQPMSDVPAAAWVALAVVLALQTNPTSAFFAGLAAGAAVITRPALLVAAALIPLVSFRGERRWQGLIASAIGAAIGVVTQMALQAILFGSPLASGYGPAANLFAWSHVPTNAAIFIKHSWTALGPIWLLGLIGGLPVTRPGIRSRLLAIMAAVALPYMFYLPFDHWETLRFLLPGLAVVTPIVAAGVLRVARTAKNESLTAAIVIVLLAIFTGRSESLLRHSSVWDIAALEARYPLAGEWINVNTPVTSVVLANQHSGSLRWYGKRQTIRWDFIEPQRLALTVNELQSHGAAVYVALEGDEVGMFDRQFKDVIDQLQIGQLQIDHVGSIRNVSFRRLVYLPPNK